jgi:opacity protein-like surface antigen
MRSFLLTGACAASMLLALTPVAQAADIDMGPAQHGFGWYVSVFGGWSIADTDVELSTTTAPITGDLIEADADLDDGFMAGGALGVYFNDWIRAEVELSGHWHDVDGELVTTPLIGLATTADLDGDADATFVLANLWLDVPVGDIIRPYIGGGVGLGRLDVELDTDAGTNVIDDSDWAFAYQLGGGIAFGLTPYIGVDVGYRYKVINNAELEASVGGGSVDLETDYKSHNVLVGLRFGF